LKRKEFNCTISRHQEDTKEEKDSTLKQLK